MLLESLSASPVSLVSRGHPGFSLLSSSSLSSTRLSLSNSSPASTLISSTQGALLYTEPSSIYSCSPGAARSRLPDLFTPHPPGVRHRHTTDLQRSARLRHGPRWPGLTRLGPLSFASLERLSVLSPLSIVYLGRRPFRRLLLPSEPAGRLSIPSLPPQIFDRPDDHNNITLLSLHPFPFSSSSCHLAFLSIPVS